MCEKNIQINIYKTYGKFSSSEYESQRMCMYIRITYVYIMHVHISRFKTLENLESVKNVLKLENVLKFK